MLLRVFITSLQINQREINPLPYLIRYVFEVIKYYFLIQRATRKPNLLIKIPCRGEDFYEFNN